MAYTASVFGCGGYDPIGTYFGNKADASYSRSMMRYQAKLQFKYQKKAAEQMPSSARQGLEAAGYNPILAVNGGANGDYGTVSASPVSAPQGVSTSFSASEFMKGKNASKLAEAEVATAQANAESAEAQATSAKASAYVALREADVEGSKLSIENDLLNGVDDNPVAETKYAQDYRQYLKNSLERARFTDSKEHAIAEDTINAIHGGSSAFANFGKGFRSFKGGK